MANTSELKAITQYALDAVSNIVGVRLVPRKLPVSDSREKAFSGVSSDGTILVQIINNSGYTSGGNVPNAKFRMVYADCYFMNMTSAKKKILAFTNEEFYKLFKDKSDGFLPDFDVIHIDLPEELKQIAQRVTREASLEMTK